MESDDSISSASSDGAPPPPPPPPRLPPLPPREITSKHMESGLDSSVVELGDETLTEQCQEVELETVLPVVDSSNKRARKFLRTPISFARTVSTSPSTNSSEDDEDDLFTKKNATLSRRKMRMLLLLVCVAVFIGGLAGVLYRREEEGFIPSAAPTKEATYYPGYLSNIAKEGVLLSTGLDIRIIALSGVTVQLANGSQSEDAFHMKPDAGATFSMPDGDGWVYVSNSESVTDGGVGSIFFDNDGRVIDYKRILSGTERNCGGGKTPWGTWISCEEPKNRSGQIFEVDPFGRESNGRKTALGEDGGRYESFSFDNRRDDTPRFFYTEDDARGPLRRFTPHVVDWNNTHEMLHGDGDIHYLVLEQDGDNGTRGSFRWTTDRNEGENSAAYIFPHSEGCDCLDGQLYFVSKMMKALFQLDLDNFIWTKSSTKKGAFDGQPDTLARLIDGEDGVLYFTEDGSDEAGVHGRDRDGNFFMILESPVYKEETTGLAFSPDGMHMYLAYQENGVLLDVWREDGLPFHGRSIDIKYHPMESS